MTNPDRMLWSAGLVSVLGFALVGCGEEEAAAPPPPAPVRVAAPPPPPPPAVTPVKDLMNEYRIDQRIVMEEERAPDNNEDRIAVLEFFDGFARGDASQVSSMLPLIDRLELEAMQDAGAWDTSVSGITEIMVQTGQGPYDDKLALAVFEVDGTYQPQLWAYTTDVDGAIFEAQPTPPGIIDRLSGDDWIARWIEINEEEMRLANQPDEDFEFEPVDLNQTSSGSSSAGSPGGPGASPGGAPGPGRRAPPKAPRKPPGPG